MSDPLDGELAESGVVRCPYCDAEVEVLVDAGGGAVQEYVEDCEVCCRPWALRVELRADGSAEVRAETLD